jgi:hypothetical protein
MLRQNLNSTREHELPLLIDIQYYMLTRSIETLRNFFGYFLSNSLIFFFLELLI